MYLHKNITFAIKSVLKNIFDETEISKSIQCVKWTHNENLSTPMRYIHWHSYCSKFRCHFYASRTFNTRIFTLHFSLFYCYTFYFLLWNEFTNSKLILKLIESDPMWLIAWMICASFSHRFTHPKGIDSTSSLRNIPNWFW